MNFVFLQLVNKIRHFVLNFSLVMVNLFVAIIVSDIDKLKHDGRIEEIRQKIYHIINSENILSCFYHLSDDLKKSTRDVCTHSICFSCKGIKVGRSTQLELENIVRKNNYSKNGSRRYSMNWYKFVVYCNSKIKLRC